MSDTTHFADRPLNLPFQTQITLEGFTLLCYRLPAARMRPFVPSGYPLLSWEEHGQVWTWFTIFIGKNVLHGVGGLPAPPIAFYQMNYRAYVEAPERSLYIFRSLVDNPLVAAGSRMALDFPAVYQPFKVIRDRFDRAGGREAVEVGVAGSELAIELEILAELPPVPGFATPHEAAQVLGHVPDAYYSLGGKRQRRIVSPHPPLEPRAARLIRGDLRWLMAERVMTRGEALEPIAVFLQESAPFPLLV